jgi:hypothetical protein
VSNAPAGSAPGRKTQAGELKFLKHKARTIIILYFLFAPTDTQIMETKNTKPVQPAVGMRVIECVWTTKAAYTIVEVINPKTIIVSNPEHSQVTVTLRTNGKWMRKGETNKASATFLVGLDDWTADMLMKGQK